MESQADDYATDHLKVLGKTSYSFIEAMQAISAASGGKTGEEPEQWIGYLSAHPSGVERIEKAKTRQ